VHRSVDTWHRSPRGPERGVPGVLTWFEHRRSLRRHRGSVCQRAVGVPDEEIGTGAVRAGRPPQNQYRGSPRLSCRLVHVVEQRALVRVSVDRPHGRICYRPCRVSANGVVLDQLVRALEAPDRDLFVLGQVSDGVVGGIQRALRVAAGESEQGAHQSSPSRLAHSPVSVTATP